MEHLFKPQPPNINAPLEALGLFCFCALWTYKSPIVALLSRVSPRPSDHQGDVMRMFFTFRIWKLTKGIPLGVMVITSVVAITSTTFGEWSVCLTTMGLGVIGDFGNQKSIRDIPYVTVAEWFVYMGIYIMLSKLYLNSLLASLAARSSLRAQIWNAHVSIPPIRSDWSPSKLEKGSMSVSGVQFDTGVTTYLEPDSSQESRAHATNLIVVAFLAFWIGCGLATLSPISTWGISIDMK
ncbi:hypothetical protein NLI96_g5409 [Meripilus lineatus]|uniref:Uncharacterized protein n=1 Tax=Meripilus lineatus TaxID=2056292 RepID=A0AAD5YDX8_9APHY|nr:hypothetical protein NLI96_g5409 [Physisporinus lineatus]